MGLGVSTHFKFKIGGVRQRDEKASGWTRQALQGSLSGFSSSRTLQGHTLGSLHCFVPVAALHSK